MRELGAKKFKPKVPVAILAGIGAVLVISGLSVLVSSFRQQNQLPLTSPSPKADVSPSPSANLGPITNSLSKSPKVNGLGEDNSNLSPSPIVISTQTYRTLSLSELVNTIGANGEALAAAYSAYNTFLQTPNLEYMTPAQQQEIFMPLLTASIQKSVGDQALLQTQINSLNQQLYSNPPIQSQAYNQPSVAYQTCVNNKTASINNNPWLSESQRLGQIERAKQDCANQN